MKDILSGIFFATAGLFFLINSFGYRIGSISDMGPGFFPVAFSLALFLIGAVIIIRELVKRGRS